jgi:hypothetical protein
MLRVSRWMAVAVVMAVPAFASDRFEKTMSGSVTYNGGRVIIEHRFGRVVVHAEGGNEVSARAMVRSSDAELGKRVHFSISNSSGGVSIRTIFPEMHRHGECGDCSYSADLDVTIPERAPLFLRSRFGSIEASGLRAPLDIVNGQGSITLRDIRGGRIENSFGSIRIDGSGGDTTVQNANGSISVSEVQGALSVTNRFASIVVRDVTKGLSIANTNGSVNVSDVRGPTSISDSFASIDARNIGGPTSIANQNGNVTADDIGGDLNVDTRFGLVKAAHIRGNFTVDNANGGVSATDINGNARVNTSFASVFLKDIGGGVSVENQNGAIAVNGLRGGCNPISLRTTYAPIKIGIAGNASYTVTARTTYGMITTDVPFTITTKNSSENSSSLAGKIRGGECKMDLVTSNGGITISRD